MSLLLARPPAGDRDTLSRQAATGSGTGTYVNGMRHNEGWRPRVGMLSAIRHPWTSEGLDYEAGLCSRKRSAITSWQRATKPGLVEPLAAGAGVPVACVTTSRLAERPTFQRPRRTWAEGRRVGLCSEGRARRAGWVWRLAVVVAKLRRGFRFFGSSAAFRPKVLRRRPKALADKEGARAGRAGSKRPTADLPRGLDSGFDFEFGRENRGPKYYFTLYSY